MATVKPDRNCKKCILHQSAQVVCLMGRGPIPCDVMVIGEAPGQREDDIGKPFQGPAGHVLDQAFEAIGLDRSKLYITNTVRCRPPKNRAPKTTEIYACSDWMAKEIRIVKPKFILLLGRIATKVCPIWSKGIKLDSIRGKPVLYNGIYYFATYHPGACLPFRDKRGYKLSQLKVDLAHFAKIVENGGPLKQTDVNKKVVTSVEIFNEMVKDITETTNPIALDVETMGLNEWEEDKHIVLLGIATSNYAWCLPLWTEHTRYHRKAPFKSPQSRQMAMGILKPIVESKKVVTQNGKFDWLWLKKEYGWNFEIWFDTLIAHAVIDENSAHDLTYLCSRYLSVPSYDISVEEKQGYGITLKKHTNYLARDIRYTLRIAMILIKELKKDPRLNEFFWAIPIKAFNMYCHAEYNGMYINKDRFQEAAKQVSIGLSGPLHTLNLIADVGFKKSILWSSPKQVGRFFFEEIQLPILSDGLTKTGAPSTNESILKRLANLPRSEKDRLKISEIATKEKHNPRVFFPGTEIVYFEGHKQDLPKMLLQYREAKKLNEFIVSWGAKADKKGRIHPSYKMQTVTGRPSCTEPNIQQTPRNKVIRSCIDAPDGWTLVTGDYSQVELRFVAMRSRDPVMLATFQTGGDIHVETAQGVLHRSTISEDERKKAKAVNFGFIYGMGWPKFINYARDNYGVEFSESESRKIRRDYFERYNHLPKWHERQRRIARAQGYVRNMAGRVRHLPGIYSDDEGVVASAERMAINADIQSIASDNNLAAAIEVHETLPRNRVRVTATVHDEIHFWVRTKYLDEYLPMIAKIMLRPSIIHDKLCVEYTVPIEIEIKVGPWGIGKTWDHKSSI